MGFDESVGLRQRQLTEWLTITSDDLDALLLQRLNRFLFRLKSTRSGVDCRFPRRNQKLIAQRRFHPTEREAAAEHAATMAAATVARLT